MTRTKHPRELLAAMVGLSAATALAACGGANAPVLNDEADDCAAACAKETGLPNCPSSPSCTSACTNPRGLPSSCHAAYASSVHCAAISGQVTGCDSKGGAIVTGCESEQNAILACLSASGPDATGTSGSGTDCATVCSRETGLPNCTLSTCLEQCENPENIPARCQSAYAAVVHCAAVAGQITGCDAAGAAQITGCNEEEEALLSCVSSGVDGGESDEGADGGTCAALKWSNPSCNSCMAQRCCWQETACANNADCMFELECGVLCTPGQPNCENDCAMRYPLGRTAFDAMATCQQGNCASQCT
jgi:hypothetical protein